MILESLESWLNSKIPKLVLVIPVFQIRDLCIKGFVHNMQKNTKHPKVNVEIIIPDSKIST